MKIKDFEKIIYNQHGCAFRSTVLWNYDGRKINEYASGIHEYIINNFPEKDVIRIEAEIINDEPMLVIQTN